MGKTNNKCIYFLAVIEGDFLINASISKIIKIYFSEYKSICLLPQHPRVQDEKLKYYYNNFDEVIDLPNCSFNKRILKGIGKAKQFQKAFNKIEIPSGSLLFMFDVYTLPEFLIYNYVRRKRKDMQLTFITPVLGDQFDKKKTKLLFFPTIVNTIYAFYFGGRSFFKAYQRKGTSLKGFKKINQKSDFQICIENSTSRTMAKQVFSSLPYPLPVLDLPESKLKLTFDRSILILISTNHGKRWGSYWDDLREILSRITQKSGINILVKDHPGVKSVAEKELSEFDFQFVNNKLTAEQLCMDPDMKLTTVIGYASTALLTSSWLGFRTIDYTRLLDYSVSVHDYYTNFIKLGKDIIRLEKIEELEDFDFSKVEPVHISSSYIEEEWNKILINLFEN